MAYVTSTQLYNWRLSEAELAKRRATTHEKAVNRIVKYNEQLPADGSSEKMPFLSVADELDLVKRYIFIMLRLFDSFSESKLPSEVFGFAAHYFRRFYLDHSAMDFYPREIMLTSLYLACKCADHPMSLHSFVSHIPRNRERYAEFIVNSELFLIEAIGYDLTIHTPHRPLLGYIIHLISYLRETKPDWSSLSADDCARVISELRQAGDLLIHKWLQTDLCFTIHPSEFALAVLVNIGANFTPTSLDVESFVRDELCRCDPVKKSASASDEKEAQDNDEDDDSDDESSNEADSVKDEKNTVRPEERWKQVRRLLDQVQDYVNEFQFIVELGAQTDVESILEKCRNPLYNPDSDEYKEARHKADVSLLYD